MHINAISFARALESALIVWWLPALGPRTELDICHTPSDLSQIGHLLWAARALPLSHPPPPSLSLRLTTQPARSNLRNASLAFASPCLWAFVLCRPHGDQLHNNCGRHTPHNTWSVSLCTLSSISPDLTNMASFRSPTHSWKTLLAPRGEPLARATHEGPCTHPIKNVRAWPLTSQYLHRTCVWI